MNGGVTAGPAVKSVLSKPLHELTEDDISQLTREDCRRFLKEKGMRRPSWNKSQAIQQVISLKSLLEPSLPNAAVKPFFRRPPLNSATTNNTFTVNSISSSSAKELSQAEVEGSVTALGEDRCTNHPEGRSGLDAQEGECRADDTQHNPDRCKDAPNDQMTIFYSGKVNVYDGVPVDKACAIMHLAASPIQFCQDEPSGENLPNVNIPSQLPYSSVKLNLATPDAPSFQSLTPDVEGHTNRQVSLQRYYEKRKDRGKFKMKRKIGSSSGLEMYLSHQMKSPIVSTQNSEGNTSATSQLGVPHTGYETHENQLNSGLSPIISRQNSESNTSATSQLGVPQTCYETQENHLKNYGLSVDLNDKA